jgi:hypothetical protein
VALLVAMTSSFVTPYMATAINVALPTIATEMLAASGISSSPELSTASS